MSIDPVVAFFLVGIAVGFLGTDLRLPKSVLDFLTVFLLLAIGLKGGVELAGQPIVTILPKTGVVILMGVGLTLVGFSILKVVGRFDRANAASIAAHYGSVSVGTFAVATDFLISREVEYESYLALFLVVLELPAIIVGVMIGRSAENDAGWWPLAKEVITGKAIVLVVAGIAIGWMAGAEKLVSVTPFFFDLFSGVLCLFLLEMGLLCAGRMLELRKHGPFLIVFGIVMPLISGVVGTFTGVMLGLSIGGSMLLATLAASASYIAVPAAMRVSVHDANVPLALSASLGVTFPFNVTIGLPIYLAIATWAVGS